jgi:plasmid stabilization system protein ParE
VEHWSEKQADSYDELLTSFCSTLAKQPETGRHYPEIGLEIRGISIRRLINQSMRTPSKSSEFCTKELTSGTGSVEEA